MFTIISAKGTEVTVSDVAAAFDAVERIAVAADMYGGHDIHGTYAIAYHGHKGCGGHEVARVFDTDAMNATTAASLAAVRAGV